MFALSVLVMILWTVSSIVGDCVGPTCSGDETTCESIAGCEWSEGDSGYCSQSSCSSGTGESACKAIDYCAWQSTGSSCSKPTSKYCSALTEETCSDSGSGCRWVAPSGECSGPTSKQCDAKTQTECVKEESGCGWSSQISSPSCQSNNDACYSLSRTTCKGKSGCEWRSGNCTYTGCKTDLAKDACENDNHCLYFSPQGYCRAPQNNKCTNLNPTVCEKTPSCHFQPDQYDCISSNPGVVFCSPSYADGKMVSCGEGCTKRLYSYGICEPDSVGCNNNADNTGCSVDSVTKGCFWDPNYQRGYCDFNYGCEALSTRNACYSKGCEFDEPQGSCIDRPEKETCSTLDAETCSTTEYCEISGENCIPRESNCWNYNQYYNSDPAGCDADLGCVWQGDRGSCYQRYMPPSDSGVEAPEDEDDSARRQRSLGDSVGACVNNDDITACSDGSPSGCSFSGGYCYSVPVSCSKSESGNDCSEASKEAGCVWNPGKDYSECNTQWRPKCYLNEAKTACDKDSSASSCTFKSSPGRCEVNYDLVCSVKADGSGCETDSTAKGCKWIADGGKCSNSRTCYRNSNGDGCEVGDGGTGCTWRPATTGSCRQSSSCSSNATGDGCTAASIDAGCVWNANDGSAASTMIVPGFLLLLLLLFSL